MIGKRGPVAGKFYMILKSSCTEFLEYHSTSEKKNRFSLLSKNKIKVFKIVDVSMHILENMASLRFQAKRVLLNPSISVASICRAKHQEPHPAGKWSSQTSFHSRHAHSDTAFTAF